MCLLTGRKPLEFKKKLFLMPFNLDKRCLLIGDAFPGVVYKNRDSCIQLHSSNCMVSS